MDRPPGQASSRLGEPEPETVASLVDYLPDALVVIDSQFRLRWANRRAEHVFGRSLAESVGLSCIELVHPDDLELAVLSMETVRHKEVGAAIELRVSTTGGWRLVELVGRPVRWCGQDAVALSLRDLTERRRFELAHDSDARFRTLVQNSAVVVMLVSPGGILLSVSGALTRQLGHDLEFVENRPLTEIVDEEDHETLSAALARAGQGATAANPVTAEVRLRRREGTEAVPYELTIVNLLDDPTAAGLLVTCHDVTDRTLAQRELIDALSLLTATLESTADGILVVDRQGHITSHNRRFAEMWHIPEHVLEGRDHSRAFQFVLDQLVNPEAFVAKVEDLYSRPEAESSDTLIFKDGRVFERYSKPQSVEGSVVGRVWSFRDVTERKRLEAELVRQALRDPLTGLANRPLFVECVEKAMARARRDRQPLAVLFIDLDRFKHVNDSLGHGAGDQLLVEAASRIRTAVRESDQVARFGGDEFAVLCQDFDVHRDIEEIATRVLEVFEQPFSCGQGPVYVSASIGIATSSMGVESVESLLQDADTAMYRAKDSGRGRFEVFDQTMRYWVAHRLDLESSLRRAADNHEFEVHYQPIIDSVTSSVRAFEALVRWPRPGCGFVSPREFIPVAEETGLVFSIGEWVLGEACREAASWAERWPERRLDLAVNISSRQLFQGNIVETVGGALTSSGLVPHRLTLELTETTLIDDAFGARAVIERLRGLGVKIALDDFGTGYSSLTYLRTFPIDMIKIDQSFVRTVETEQQGTAIVAAIAQLARNLGIEVVAEGIETPSQRDALVRVGCDGLQGFLYSPATPAAEIAGLVELFDDPARGSGEEAELRRLLVEPGSTNSTGTLKPTFRLGKAG